MRATGGIRRRLFRWLLPPLLGLFAVGVIGDFYAAYKPAEEAYDQGLADNTLALSTCLHQDGQRVVLELNAQAEAILRANQKDRIFYAVFADDGHRIAGDKALPFLPSSDELSFQDASVNGQDVRVAILRHPFEAVGQTVWIEAAETTIKREYLKERLIAVVAGPNLALILATLAIVMIGVRFGLAPLDRLRKTVEARSPRDLS